MIVAFPFLLLLGSTSKSQKYISIVELTFSSACGIGILVSFAKIGEAEIFATELQQWIVSFFSLTLATNIICTGTPHWDLMPSSD